MENEHLKRIVGIVSEIYVFFTFTGYPVTVAIWLRVYHYSTRRDTPNCWKSDVSY